MSTFKILVISVAILFTTSCVQLPDLNPFNSNNDMTYVELTQPIVIDVGTPIFELIYNDEVQATIEFLDIATERHIKITSAQHGNGEVLTDPIRIAQPFNKKKVKLLEPNQLTGAWVVGAEWQQSPWLNSWICNLNSPVPCYESVCHPGGPTVGNCQFTDRFLAFRANFEDGIHYGWIELSITGLDGLIRVESYAFSNTPGSAVRMGEIN